MWKRGFYFETPSLHNSIFSEEGIKQNILFLLEKKKFERKDNNLIWKFFYFSFYKKKKKIQKCKEKRKKGSSVFSLTFSFS